MRKDEAVAYIADAMYMRELKVVLTNEGKLKALYDAAYSLIDKKRLLKNPGTTLSWADCEALLIAIKAIPEYR